MSAEQLEEVSAPCPVCGSHTGASLATASPLLAVCDVLVIRALEVAGKRIVRADRARFRALGTRPWHVAHTLWAPDQAHVVKSLVNAWDVVPALLDSYGCCGVTSRQVTKCLDRYTADLLLTGTAHSLAELRYRFSSELGIDLPDPREHAYTLMESASATPALVATHIHPSHDYHLPGQVPTRVPHPPPQRPRESVPWQMD